MKNIDVYLITGFLGAGKTTFLKELLQLFKGKKLQLIINEFGKEGIDGALLSPYSTNDISLFEIINGSIFCSCKVGELETALKKTVASSPDVIVIEASGLSDPTSVKKIMSAFKELTLKATLCLVDSKNFLRSVNSARVTKKQLSISDLVIINKTDLVGENELLEVVDTLKSLYPFLPFVKTQFGKVEKEWVENASSAKKISLEDVHTKDIGLQKAMVTVKESMKKQALLKFLEMIVEDTFRIKGFVCLNEEQYLIDCVGADIAISPYSEVVSDELINKIVFLSGSSMALGKAVKTAVEWYKDDIVSVE